MNNIISLDQLNISKKAKVFKINSDYELKRRLEDLGLIKGCTIQSEFKSPFNDPTAYLIKGCTIAIRNKDAKNILVIPYE